MTRIQIFELITHTTRCFTLLTYHLSTVFIGYVSISFVLIYRRFQYTVYIYLGLLVTVSLLLANALSEGLNYY